MPFIVDKAELDRYASGLEHEVGIELRGALGWFGADEMGRRSRYGHPQLPRRGLDEDSAELPPVPAYGNGAR